MCSLGSSIWMDSPVPANMWTEWCDMCRLVSPPDPVRNTRSDSCPIRVIQTVLLPSNRPVQRLSPRDRPDRLWVRAIRWLIERDRVVPISDCIVDYCGMSDDSGSHRHSLLSTRHWQFADPQIIRPVCAIRRDHDSRRGECNKWWLFSHIVTPLMCSCKW